MEKFGTWRDAGTGIQPFVPPKPPRTDISTGVAVLLGLKNYLLGPVLAVLRILLLTIVALWLLLFSSIGALIPVPVLRRGFQRYVFALGARAILLFMGFWWIQASSSTTKRGRSATTQTSSSFPGSHLGSGDIIACNHTSYAEILYLAFRFAPVFTQVFTKKGSQAKGLVRPISWFTAISNVFGMPVTDAANFSDAVTLQELSAKARKSGLGPIVVFPEATTTNGKTILKFAPVFEGFADKEAAIQVVGFKFEYEEFSPTYTAGNPFGHFFVLCCQLHSSLSVKYVPVGENPSLQTPVETENKEDPLGEQITTCLTNVLHLRKAQLTVEEKIEFLNYFNERTKGYKSEKAKAKTN